MISITTMVVSYLIISTILAVYVFFEFNSDPKTRDAAFLMALVMYAWPLVLLFVAIIYFRAGRK